MERFWHALVRLQVFSDNLVGRLAWTPASQIDTREFSRSPESVVLIATIKKTLDMCCQLFRVAGAKVEQATRFLNRTLREDWI